MLVRIQRIRQQRLGCSILAGDELAAAAEARVGAVLALRLANELAVALALLHGALRVQRTHARGHLVTGASPATSPCGDGYGKQGGDDYGDQTGARLGGK